MFFYMFYSFHQYQIYVLCIFMYLFHSHIYLYIYSEKTEVKNVSLFCLHDMWFSPHSVVMLLNPSCRKQGPREPLQSSTSTYWRYKKKAYRHMQVCACVDTTDHAVPLVLRVSCFSWRATSCLNWPTTPFSPPPRPADAPYHTQLCSHGNSEDGWDWKNGIYSKPVHIM